MPKVTVLDGPSSAVVSADLTVGLVDLTPEPVPDVPAGSLEGADFGPEGPSPVEAEADAARAVAEEARGVVVDFAEIEAEEEPCPDPGTDSQTSSPKPDSTPPPNDDSDPSPARTAGNPSKTGRKRRG